MMRVLMVFRKLGIWHRYRRQITELAKRCDGFTVFYQEGRPPSEEHVTFVKGFLDALSSPADLVYCLTGAWMQLHALALSLLKRIPLVIRLRGDGRRMDEIWGAHWAKKLVKSVIRRLSFRRAAAIIPIAGHLEEVARSQWGRNVTEPVPNGVDLDHFKPGPMPDEFTVGYVGRDTPEKNMRFVGHLELMRRDLPFIYALGDVPYTEMPEFYNRCSVLVLPSLMEGFSNVLLEAYACGREVICGPDAVPDRFPAITLPLKLELWASRLDHRFYQYTRSVAEEYTWDRYADAMIDYMREASTS